MLKTHIGFTDPTNYFKNSEGATDLTVQEVIGLVNVYIQEVNKRYYGKEDI